MYIVLILIIISFLMAFIPIIGIIPTVICSGISIIFSAIAINKKPDKKKKELAIISIIIAIISFIVCIIINCISINKLLKYMDKLSQDEIMSYIKIISSYDTYNINEEALTNDLKLSVNSMDKDGYEYIVDLNVQCLAQLYDFSVYDFCIYDVDNNEIYYPKYSSEYTSFYSKILTKNETNNMKIKFYIDEKIGNMYFIYRKGDNCVKFKI